MGSESVYLFSDTKIFVVYFPKIWEKWKNTLTFNRNSFTITVARGQNSAPCRVIVEPRFVQSYILGFLFARLHSKAAALSGFFCV